MEVIVDMMIIEVSLYSQFLSILKDLDVFLDDCDIVLQDALYLNTFLLQNLSL